ncbi:anthranilate phosphoribosyltransferase [Planctomicrobium sp. SH661]|uniref:anthranilate phosphoribosyltransferase n=1 Tax=Planctomicrobium sp. SH661 TaxID=3448124 RepID=UPI003F5C8B95
MQSEIRHALNRLLAGESLTAEAMQEAIGAVMDGRCSEVEISAFLVAIAMKGETEEELAGGAIAMRKRAAHIQSTRSGLIDTCGTGGDQLHTFNISTATAFVIAAAGVPVAKHGNRSVSSSSGSADVLEALGVNIELTPEQAGKCLDDVGLCFCYARNCHSAMKHVAPVRQQLGIRTVFNLLGPLTNPARAEYQLLGASKNSNAARIAGAVSRLNLKRACIVCGNDQLDEVSLWGTTQVWEVSGTEQKRWSCTAEDFGLNPCQPDELRVSSPQESAAVICGILEGERGPAREIVLANAAMALYCREETDNLQTAVKRVAAAIDDGSASRILNQLREWTTRI